MVAYLHITPNFQQFVFRVGELEAAIAHKDYELEQASTRIKQFESMIARFIIKINSFNCLVL